MHKPEGSARILVAEDDADHGAMLAMLLKDFGAEVTLVPDGEAALREAGRHTWDLVVLDVEMPRLDGLEACRRLRELPFAAHLPVLMITGYTDAQTVDRAFAAGASDFLPKPIHMDLLRSRVKNLISLARLTRENQRLAEAVQTMEQLNSR